MRLDLILQSSFLGILQGLTEFFPVSSSGHLVIVQQFFPQISQQPVLLDIILHLGTVLALIFYFRCEIKNLFSKPKQILYIILALVVTVLIIIPFKPIIKKAFTMPKLASLMLLVTGLLLFIASRFKNNHKKEVKTKEAIGVGIFQALAALPGLSRSGATIASGIFLGLESLTAFKFSFLLAIPTIAGAGILDLEDIKTTPPQLFLPYLFGFIFSFLAGLLAINFLIKKIAIKQNRLIYFALYCFIVGLATLFIL